MQGVQIRHDAKQHRYLAFLSHDSLKQAYVVVVAFDESLLNDGEIIHVHRFAEGRLRHAGEFSCRTTFWPLAWKTIVQRIDQRFSFGTLQIHVTGNRFLI